MPYFSQTGKLNRFLLTLRYTTVDTFGKRLNLACMQVHKETQMKKKKKYKKATEHTF